MRLIDADAFQKWMLKSEYNASENEKYDNGDNIDRPLYYSTISLIDVMNYQAPTIDAVQVVRCKNCKKRQVWNGVGLCGLMVVNDNDFCSWGESK